MIRNAELSDLTIIQNICRTTIKEIYPHYYPKGAVEFFLEHHNEKNIISDINKSIVFICIDNQQNPVGTVTLNNNEICRLFVLPEHQGNGYGCELLEFAEESVFKQYDEIILDSSLPAKRIYLKRGYKEIKSDIISTNYGDFLCYDVMIKQL